MTILLLKGYNNYFNRIVKQEADITAYKSASTSYLEYANVNFDPQDGIATSLVVGGDTQKKVETVSNQQVEKILDFESGGSPDYLIVHDNIDINSRWFIVECVRVRAGQYKLALKRDVLVDFYGQVMNSPCYVEKGSITAQNDPLLLNPEGVLFNQIKKKEKLLKDNTNCAWLVGYFKKDTSDLPNRTFTYTFPESITGVIDVSTINQAITYEPLSGNIQPASKKAIKLNNAASSVSFRTYYDYDTGNTVIAQNIRTTIGLDYSLKLNKYDAGNTTWEELNSPALKLGSTQGDLIYFYNDAKKLGEEIHNHTQYWSAVTNAFNNLVASAKYDAITNNGYLEVDDSILEYDGKYVLKDGAVYKLSVTVADTATEPRRYTGQDTISNAYLTSLYYQFTPNTGRAMYLNRNTSDASKFKLRVDFSGTRYNIIAREEPLGDVIGTLPVDLLRTHCEDAPYDMFCLPISPAALGLGVYEGNSDWNSEPIVYIASGLTSLGRVSSMSKGHLAFAMQVATKMGATTEAGYFYDLQVLPYCPVKNLSITTTNSSSNEDLNPSSVTINIANLTEGKDYIKLLDDQNAVTGIMFFPNSCNFSSDITNIKIRSSHIESKEMSIINPIFEYDSHDEDNHPLYWYTFPYKIANYAELNNTSWNNLPLELPEGWDEDNMGVAGIAFSDEGVTIYFSDNRFNVSVSGWPSSQTLQGTLSLTADWIIPDEAIDRKIKNECDIYRITAPTFNGMFEFKESKFLNGVDKFNVDCTYKPFTPYIKVNPAFTWLYGKDFNDSTGLICGGDYSLPLLSDAMVNYELQNRNYQAIFNRSITNLDINNQIAKEQQQFQGIVGMVTGGIGGAASGAYAGFKGTKSPWGAALGAAVGGIGGTALAGIGYEKDKDWLARQQGEARDFAIDNYTYQLGNVQALPQTVTKSSPLSYNNKIWPILEYFSCTDEEKEILRKKLKYDGMTIMAISKLQDYSNPGSRLKGKMIRLENLEDDSHIAQAIYEEVDKGFYQGE